MNLVSLRSHCSTNEATIPTVGPLSSDCLHGQGFIAARQHETTDGSISSDIASFNSVASASIAYWRGTSGSTLRRAVLLRIFSLWKRAHGRHTVELRYQRLLGRLKAFHWSGFSGRTAAKTAFPTDRGSRGETSLPCATGRPSGRATQSQL